MRTRMRERGVTRVEVVVTLATAMLCLSLGLSCFAERNRGTHRTLCQSNIRQLGLAIENYASEYRVMPSVHRNVWWQVAGYLGLGRTLGSWREPEDMRIYPSYAKCPNDTLRSSQNYACSYGLNYQDCDPYAVGIPGDAQNQKWSPFSNNKLTDTAPAQDLPHPNCQVKGLGSAAPNTVLISEAWSADNWWRFVGRDQPPYPGTEAAWKAQSFTNCPYACVNDYGATKGEGTLKADGKWYVTAYTPRSDTPAFRLGRGYRERAKIVGDIPGNELYHAGRINVLFVDQHVESMECQAVFGSAIMTNGMPNLPFWTATED